jgi:Family of unknown function (DUF6502)
MSTGMDIENRLPRMLTRSVERLLAALFRVLLHHGMSFVAFEALAKRVYVDVALRDFGIPGKKPSISRAAILSGLTRKEVQRLVAEGAPDAPEAPADRDNRAIRVLSAWTRDADFADEDGTPRVLPLQEGAASFAALVRRYSGDVPVRAVLDELVRVGAVQRRDDGGVELLQRAFLASGAVDKIEHLGTDVADLVRTIDHNIEHGDDPRFQRRVMYHDMPASVVAEFRKLSATQAMALLVKLDRWLAARSAAHEAADADPKQASVRLGMGIYYFEEALDSSQDRTGRTS